MKFMMMTLLVVVKLFGESLSIGIVPQQSPIELIKDWQPIITYLEKTTGEKIVFKTERSIGEFEKVLYSGGYDIAYINPYHYVIAHKKQGYDAKIRDEKNLVGILVTKKEGGIPDVSMCQGKEFLFPSPDAFAATMLIKYELLKRYKIDINGDKSFRYVNSHDSVYKGVSRGVGHVGGGIERTFNDLNDQETKESLRILYKTKAYPSHPFVVKSSMSEERKVKIIKAFLDIPNTLIAPLKIKRLVETKDTEYDVVRDIVKYLPQD